MPAIEFVCRQIDIGLDEISVVAVDVGPGLFTGMRVGLASAKAIAQALRIPMIGISSLDLLAFPCRHSDRVVVPVIDARKGEVFYAMYRQVPGGVQQVAEPRVGPVEDLVADLLARSQDVLCVGDGALRYRDEILEGFHCEIGDDAHPSAAPLVQLADARALREDWVNAREIEPIYLRAPDAKINWSTRASRPMSVIERLLRRDDTPPDDVVVLSKLRRRDLKAGVLAIEAVSYPRPWSQGVFESEIDQMRSGSRHYVVARRGPGDRRLRRPVVQRRRGPRHERGRPAGGQTGRDRHPPAAGARRRRPSPGVHGVDARGAGVEHRGPGAVPPVRVRAGWHPPAVLREHGGCDRHVVQRLDR